MRVGSMKIPVFVSCPTALNEKQKVWRNFIDEKLDSMKLEPRTLGKGDYPTEYPLREVYCIARHCAGGIIMGFSQFETESGVWKKETEFETEQKGLIAFPSPWNQLEAGILFGLKLPLLIFREENISGGVFDPGTTTVFIHTLEDLPIKKDTEDIVEALLLKWAANVRQRYYDFPLLING
jgi:hypothetical protein